MKKIIIHALWIILCSCAHGGSQNGNAEYSVEIPPPTGAYKVGSREIDIGGEGLENGFILLKSWYPAVVKADMKVMDYDNAVNISERKKLWEKYYKIDPKQVTALDTLKSNSYSNGDLAPSVVFPVLLFIHGAGMSFRDYSAICEDLASQGFIVFSMNHPFNERDDNLSEEEVVKQLQSEHKKWMTDENFILRKIEELNRGRHDDFFSKRLNLNQLGIVGHSFGGSVAIQVCAGWHPCRASVNMDGFMQGSNIPAKLNKPTLFLTADDWKAGSPEFQEISKAKSQEIVDLANNSKIPGIHQFLVKKSDHMTFSDIWLIDSFNERHQTYISGKRGVEITRKVLGWFLGKDVTNTDVAFPDSQHFPELCRQRDCG